MNAKQNPERQKQWRDKFKERGGKRVTAVLEKDEKLIQYDAKGVVKKEWDNGKT